MEDCRTQIAGPLSLDEPRPVLLGDMSDALAFNVLFNLPPNSRTLAGHGECGQACLRIIRRQYVDRAKSLGYRVGKLARVPRRPNTGAIDAPAAAVDVDAFDDQIEVVHPTIDEVITQQ